MNNCMIINLADAILLLLAIQLHGLGKQHREVQGEESEMFISYFTEIEILPGG